MTMCHERLTRRITGCLIGTAVGDALGLPYEALSRSRQRKMFPRIDGHRLVFGRGMFSDDTEHVCMTAQALLASAGNLKRFERSLAWRLRFWLLGLPAGVGSATLRSIFRLWIGIPPSRSGVRSAGNGPAMRSALLGVMFCDDAKALETFVHASTRMTHNDPRAKVGALVIALVAAIITRSNRQVTAAEVHAELREAIATESAPDLMHMVSLALDSAAAGESCEAFLSSHNLDYGIGGFINHTVPCVIQVWIRHQSDYEAGVLEIIRCGGDTDTTAAILGGLIGIRVGDQGIPEAWKDAIVEWPRNLCWIENVARELSQPAGKTVPLFVPGIVLRNLIFLLIIFLHVCRRMLTFR